MKALLKSASPRVVSVSSLSAWGGSREVKFDFEKKGATACTLGFYGESKIDNLLFMRELGRRYPKLISVAAHPGSTSTDLLRNQYGSTLLKALFQSVASGALPILRAATEQSLKTGSYFGPRGLGFAGYPVGAWLPPLAKDDLYAKALWEASEKATGVSY